MEDHAISTLDLTIGSRVSDRGPVNSDAVPVTKVQELLPGEVSPMVSDDAVGDAELVDDVEEEFDRFFRADVGDGLGLYPLGEFVDRYKQVGEATQALFEGTYHVEAPDHKRPGDRDGLKLLHRQMSLPSVELTSLTPVDDVLCILYYSGESSSLVLVN